MLAVAAVTFANIGVYVPVFAAQMVVARDLATTVAGSESTSVSDAELTEAEVYVEATRSQVYGRWYVLADDSVIYERPSGTSALASTSVAYTDGESESRDRFDTALIGPDRPNLSWSGARQQRSFGQFFEDDAGAVVPDTGLLPGP